MKNLQDPRILMIFGIATFLIALLDSVFISDASGFGDLTWWGAAASGATIAIILYLAVMMMIWPVIKKIWDKLFK